MKKLILVLLLAAIVTLSFNCSTKRGMGVGPVTTDVSLQKTLDREMVDSGRAVFHEKCSGCHNFTSASKGPVLYKITERRRPEWIMNMVLNPVEMMRADPFARELLTVYPVSMITSVSDIEEARNVLEYLRYTDENYLKIVGLENSGK